jgi:hypothetical protein
VAIGEFRLAAVGEEEIEQGPALIGRQPLDRQGEVSSMARTPLGCRRWVVSVGCLGESGEARRLGSAPHRDSRAADREAVSRVGGSCAAGHHHLRSVATGATKDIRGALAFVDAAQAASVKLPRAGGLARPPSTMTARSQSSGTPHSDNAEILCRRNSLALRGSGRSSDPLANRGGLHFALR